MILDFDRPASTRTGQNGGGGLVSKEKQNFLDLNYLQRIELIILRVQNRSSLSLLKHDQSLSYGSEYQLYFTHHK